MFSTKRRTMEKRFDSWLLGFRNRKHSFLKTVCIVVGAVAVLAVLMAIATP